MASSRRFLLPFLILSLTIAFAASAALPDCPDDDSVDDLSEEPIFNTPTKAGTACFENDRYSGKVCGLNDVCKNLICEQRRDASSICDDDEQCGTDPTMLIKRAFEPGPPARTICAPAADGVRRCTARVDIGDGCGDAYPGRACGATLGAGNGGYFFSPRPERRIFPGVLVPADPPIIQDVDGTAAMSCVEGRCAASAPGGLGHVCDGGGCDDGLTCQMDRGIGTLFEGPLAKVMRCVRIAPIGRIGVCGQEANGPDFLVCEEGAVCMGGKYGPSCRLIENA